MAKPTVCSFCGHNIPIGHGFTFVKKDGSILRFCGQKCKVSMLELKRKPRKYKWTAKYERKR